MDYFVLAAGVANYEHESLDPHVYALVTVAGWLMLHAVLPLIGGVIYAPYWRTLVKWIAAAAVASFAIHAGNELWKVASYGDYGTISGKLWVTAIAILLPAFAATLIGIFARKIWDRFKTKGVLTGMPND